MDPQQRIILELIWSCFENAGLVPRNFSSKRVAVYLGVFNYNYKELLERDSSIIYSHHSTGSAITIFLISKSYYFNFKGISSSVDTACSSSLQAIHQAVHSLRFGESEYALAGGINILLTPTRHISFAKTGMLSPTGQCRSFSNDADGYVRGEGASVILMKRAEHAIKDRNQIFGVIKGTAINHGARSYTLTYPNSDSQSDVIYRTWKEAGLSTEDIDYIEAHGTGIPKGDPIEWEGLEKSMISLLTKNKQIENLISKYPVGSVQSNIGHLEAAGIAGIIKIILSFKYNQLPKLQNFSSLNFRISLDKSVMYPLEISQIWNKKLTNTGEQLPRYADISSFGFGRTNSHIVLQEYFETNSVLKEEKNQSYLYPIVLK